jgi:hypothetical protein
MRRTENTRFHAAILIVRTRVYPTFLLISKNLTNEVPKGDERFYTRQQVEFDPLSLCQIGEFIRFIATCKRV